MQYQAVVYTNVPGPDAVEPLVQVCRDKGIQVVTSELPGPNQLIQENKRREPSLLFIPLATGDLEEVSLALTAQAAGPAHVVALYCPSAIGPDVMGYAFREGVLDVIDLQCETKETLLPRVSRLMKILKEQTTEMSMDRQRNHEVDVLRGSRQAGERAVARWKERTLALASVAVRIMEGDLNVAVLAPRLLIVASAASQAHSAQETAKKLGFQITRAPNGAQALETLVNGEPDVVLTDGSLPDMDAPELARQIREAVGGKSIMIIVWSSSPEKEDDYTAPGKGIDDFVLKAPGEEGAMLLSAALLGALNQ